MHICKIKIVVAAIMLGLSVECQAQGQIYSGPGGFTDRIQERLWTMDTGVDRIAIFQYRQCQDANGKAHYFFSDRPPVGAASGVTYRRYTMIQRGVVSLYNARFGLAGHSVGRILCWVAHLAGNCVGYQNAQTLNV